MTSKLAIFITALLLSSAAAQADVVISSDPTQNMTCSGSVCSPTDRQAVLNVDDLAALLATSDVTVIVEYQVKKHFKSAGIIDLRAPLSWSSATKLTLNKTFYQRGAYIEAPISVLGTGGLVITSGASFANGVVVNFANLSSVFSIAGLTYTLIGDFPTLVSDIATNPKGYYALANDYDAASDLFSKAPIRSFNGSLLGLGHAISNLHVPKGYKLCEGMIAMNNGAISHLILNNISVELDAKSRYVGGVTGCNHNSISDITVSGEIKGASNAAAGGITGVNYSNISAGRSLANVTGGDAGGIVGENDGGISSTSATGVVAGVIDTGGLAGLNTQSIQYSYATGDVSGTENNIGGFAGSNQGQIENCYSLGNIIGAGASGGFIGFNNGIIQDAYAIGTVTGGAGYTGGFAGSDLGETIATSYWDMDTSGIVDPSQGAGDPRYDPGIVGLSDVELRARLPFGFTRKVWRNSPDINGGYPYLRKNPPPM